MTLADLIPALKGPGSRRAVDKVAELRTENTRLLTFLHGAGDEIALLRWDVTVAVTRQGEAEEAAAQMRMERDTAVEERDEWRDEALRLRAKFSAQLAAEANAQRVDVPPAIRPIDGPEDEATAPIDVRPLREAAAAGLLGPVIDPGRVHAEGVSS